MPSRFRSVPFIIAANIAVFVMWKYQTTEQGIEFMAANFLVSWEHLLDGRYWSLVGSAFSHNMFWHIFINMYVLSSFGSVLEAALGTRIFLQLYFIAGILSSFTHSWVSAFLLHDPALPALGASGAIAGVVLVFSLVFPREKILIFGVIPVPAIWGAVAFVAIDVWGLVNQAGGGESFIGHGAHLGGAFAGTLYYFLFLRSKLRRPF
ncbi:MAG: rhomboid family intramembrane serine protease [Bdellovibrionia bacterium]